MTDIAMRLREAASTWRDVRHAEFLREAADEIERLRKQCVIYKDIADQTWEKQVAIERLSAALQSLTKDPPATLDEPDTDDEVIIKMRAIARDALRRDAISTDCEVQHD